MKHLAVIPARSGSKGLPDKNIKPLNGKPLMAYSIDAASRSCIFDIIHVSTDSEVYAEIAKKYGADVPFLRSAENASDNATSWSVVLEVLDKYKQMGKTFDTVTLLQPTAPLRTAEDILSAHRIMAENQADTVVSVCEVDHSPLWCGVLPDDHCMDGFLSPEAYAPRQSLRTYYRINGAVYLISVQKLQKQSSLVYDAGCYAYIMPRSRSIDIDEPLDFFIAETIMRSEKQS